MLIFILYLSNVTAQERKTLSKSDEVSKKMKDSLRLSFNQFQTISKMNKYLFSLDTVWVSSKATGISTRAKDIDRIREKMIKAYLTSDQFKKYIANKKLFN